MRWRLSLMGFDCKPTGNVRRITDKIDDEIGLKRRSVQSWRFLRLRSDGFRIFSLHAPNPQLELLR
jgi:hypothetical protein